MNREDEKLGEYLAQEAERASTQGLDDAIYVHDHPNLFTNRQPIGARSPRSPTKKLITMDEFAIIPPRRPSALDSLGQSMLLANHQSIQLISDKKHFKSK